MERLPWFGIIPGLSNIAIIGKLWMERERVFYGEGGIRDIGDIGDIACMFKEKRPEVLI